MIKFSLVLLLLILLGAQISVAQDSQLVIMQAVERGQLSMRQQAETCLPITLPPFITLPTSVKRSSELLIDKWDTFEIRARYTGTSWTLFSLNCGNRSGE